MNIIWPEHVADSWVELVSWGGALSVGIVGVIKGLLLFKRGNEIRRAELLKTLLDEFNGDSVSTSLHAIDEGKVVCSTKILLDEKNRASVRLADPALLFFSNVCYLRQNGLISTKEFAFFRWKIQRILENTSISAYIKQCIVNDCESPYKRILRYQRPRSIWQKLINILRR